ncbi:hypothetical protein AAMO2058_000985500 [Amorphochlora amoebiformis]|uniref:Ran GTPase-activating protein 1 n=1 Tax=Amorphochlora amoebiformis TaxID=1561963 RepID=A0A7S0DRC7_9EUKA
MATFVLSDGKRSDLDGKGAKELLKPLLKAIEAKTLSKFNCLRFGGKSIKLEAAKEIAEVLPKLKGVCTLDLSDIVARRETGEAREVFKVLASASEKLDVEEFLMDNNALGANGIAAIEPILSGSKKMSKISFNDCGIEKIGAERISKFVLSNGKPSKITKFHIFNNCLATAGGVALGPLIENSPNLEDIRISATRIGRDGGVVIAKALKSCRKLVSVDLSDNQFGEEAGEILEKEVFIDQKDIKNLDLSDCGLGEEHCLGIIKNLVKAKADLESFGMSHSDIRTENAEVLADLFKQCTRLKSVNLEGNDLDSEGAILIVKALADSKSPLEELNFQNNEIKATAVKWIVALLRKKASMKKLNLNACMISKKGVTLIRATLKDLKKEDCLDNMEDNDEDEACEADDEFEKLTAALSILKT